MSLFFDNNKLFDADGHLTDEGLYALKDGTLNDLGSLEAAEHLTFCDYCLLRYTALLEAAPECLKTPMRDLIPQVQALMRLRSFRILTNRYVSAAAAVVLAFSLWQFGVFGAASPAVQQEQPMRDAAPKASISQMFSGVFSGVSDGIAGALNNFTETAQSGLAQISQVGKNTLKGE